MPERHIRIKAGIAGAALIISLVGAFAVPTAAFGQAQPLPTSTNLQAFHLLSASEGWLLANQTLYRTKTGGQNWETITPPTLGMSAIRAVTFLDAQTGWLISTQTDQVGASDFVLSRTLDGGQNWQTSNLSLLGTNGIKVRANAVYLYFLDSKTGWLVIKNATSLNFSTGSLFKTLDGGQTWTQFSIPIAAPVYFVSPTIGWLAGGPAGDKLYRTQDGGQTWATQSIPVPALSTKQRLSYQLPKFDDANNGLLPAVVTIGGQSEVQLYSTHNGGDSWSLAASVPMGREIAANTSLPMSMINANDALIVTPGNQSSAKILKLANGSASSVASPSNAAGIVELDMVNEQVGWARTAAGRCTLTPTLNSNSQTSPNVRKACTSETSLLRTSDGGQTWQTIALPGVQVMLPSNILSSIYPGFDACEIPTVSQMQDWWANSPYYSANLYIGGSERGCTNAALTATYIAQLIRQGWLFIPTWVGPQGVGNSCGCTILISTDPATAYNQGVGEANAAANVAAGLGLGSAVIYYDLETFDYANSTYRNAAESFISGWSGQLRARGDQAGVYGSPCSSALSYFAYISNVPDAIWPAGGGFYAPSYDSSASVWGLDCLSDNLWSNHQRIYQYSAGHAETWGSTTYPIDSNVLDGRVANNASASVDSIGIFRPGTNHGTFYLRLRNSTGTADYTISFNPASKPYPVVGDWTGSGYDTVGIFDQANGLFTLCTVSNTAGCGNSANRRQLVLGNPNDEPLSGRWTGALNAGIGVFRPSNGLIYLKNTLNTGYADYTMVLGIPGDIGFAGDWNSDGLDSPGVYRPSAITFYLTDQLCNCSTTSRYTFQYGASGDAPVIGDWSAQGHDGVGLFRQRNGYTYLRNSLSTGYADTAFTYGIAGDVPVAGHWQLTYPPVAPLVILRPTAAPVSDGTSNSLGD